MSAHKGYPKKLSKELREQLEAFSGWYSSGYHITLNNIILRDGLIYIFDAKWIIRGNPISVTIKVTPIYSVHISGKGKRKIVKDWFATSNECDIIGKINEPYIPKLLKTFSENKFHFSVFEKIEGLTLKEYALSYNVKNGSDGYFNTAGLEESLFKIVTTFHQKFKCVHRNITPDNIIIGENSKLYLTNFYNCTQIDDRPIHSANLSDPNYTSINMMLEEPSSYDDDLESLRYTLHYFNNGTLEWLDKSSNRKILKLKVAFVNHSK